MLTLTLSLVSCGQEDGIPSGMKYACDPDIVDYSLFVPESWIVDQTTGISQAHVSAKDLSSVQVAQWNLTENISNYEEWWEDYKSSIEKVGVVEILGDGEDVTFGGITDAKKYEYKLTVGKGTDYERTYKCMVIDTITRGSVYVFLYNSIEKGDLYSSNLESVNKIIENFRFN